MCWTYQADIWSKLIKYSLYLVDLCAATNRCRSVRCLFHASSSIDFSTVSHPPDRHGRTSYETNTSTLDQNPLRILGHHSKLKSHVKSILKLMRVTSVFSSLFSSEKMNQLVLFVLTHRQNSRLRYVPNDIDSSRFSSLIFCLR
ncbi:unnamed protein product [Albugo candida]|uniref:Uncharacterized protein n=1 Tax=Albugo candida TaxID=65357 RepID=A0A024FZ82_9STRA|nr:unnamed protein product [Albugo candida]|eukprot:CCI39623.1 unnamed protein product [Albugo candida]